MKIVLLFCIMLSISISTIGQTNAIVKSKYNAKDGAILGHNIGSYNNRPLYINNSNAFILTGDQPIARLVKEQYLFGTFMVAIERDGNYHYEIRCLVHKKNAILKSHHLFRNLKPYRPNQT